MQHNNGKYKIPAGSPIHYCRGCGAHVYLIETGRRRKMPVDPDGTGHVCFGRVRKIVHPCGHF